MLATPTNSRKRATRQTPRPPAAVFLANGSAQSDRSLLQGRILCGDAQRIGRLLNGQLMTGNGLRPDP